jgi:hypothetical protein
MSLAGVQRQSLNRVKGRALVGCRGKCTVRAHGMRPYIFYGDVIELRGTPRFFCVRI